MNIKQMKIEEAINVIEATISQFYDDRAYENYILNNLFAEKKMTYIELKKKNTRVIKPKKDIDEVVNNNNRILDKWLRENKKS
ncbi:hypothetical protein [Clostridium sp.]|uniref:hypothetical protein n=2 Tax=Clostridiaceae TaxID=31979 RepID=UPI0029041856|nr:hypothetical protein [Clostridium sp.]MDU1993095.1 hypothetical protein [Clostridium sp.]